MFIVSLVRIVFFVLFLFSLSSVLAGFVVNNSITGWLERRVSGNSYKKVTRYSACKFISVPKLHPCHT